MKVKVNRNELNECIVNAISRVLSESKTRKTEDGYLKASRKGSRDAERDMMGDGFKSYNKVHKSQKEYSRKGKNNSWKNYDELDEAVVDFTVPGDEEFDDGYDMSEIPDISSMTGGKEFQGSDVPAETIVTVITDINENERDLINDILDNYEDAEYDVVDGMVAFNLPKSIRSKFVAYLRDNDVEIMKKK